MKTKSLILALIVATFTSCAGLTNVIVPNTNFSSDNMEVRRNVKFVLTKTYVLGIGGLSAKARNADIIQELKNAANLQPSEVLAYIHVSRNINAYLGLVIRVHYTASAMVMGPEGVEYEKEDVIINTNTDKSSDKYKQDGQLGGKISRRIAFARSKEDIELIIEEIKEYVKNGNISKERGDRLIKTAQDEISMRESFKR